MRAARAVGVPRAALAVPRAPDRAAVGILGGSFNPAHAGHLHISREAVRRLRLAEVWWLVSPQNPLKPTTGMAPLADRVAQATRLAAGDRRIRVTACEVVLGTRYTADTLVALRRARPRLHLVWIVGADNLAQMPRWNRWPDILRAVPIAALPRGTYAHAAVRGAAAQRFRSARLAARSASGLARHRPPAWCLLPTPLHPASATALRAAAGRTRTDGSERTSGA